MIDDDRIRWDSYEFKYREKTRDWFWLVGIITVSSALIFMIFDNVLFGIFILIAGFILMYSSQRKPYIIEFELTNKGVIIGGQMLPFRNIYSFFIFNDKVSPPKLLLKTNRKIAPIVVVPIETDYVDAETIHDFLIHFLPEEEMHESLSHRLFESLGF